MRDLAPIQRVSAGAIGPPGRRRFFIHVRAEGSDHWFLMEKQQVAVVAERVLELLREAGYDGEVDPAGELPDVDPTGIDFRVGEIAIGVMEDAGVIAFTFFATEDDESEAVTFEATFAQVAGMAQAGLVAVAGGRPQCPRCNLPIDPEGHTCPASNGDLRRQRS